LVKAVKAIEEDLKKVEPLKKVELKEEGKNELLYL
jgi:hypothetical protein